MSEPIPESIPTSADPRSHRPLKRARIPAGSNSARTSATSAQANEIENLFLDPTREVKIPPPSSERKKTLPAPPEIVANVQGSSAGAGSGEFHVYKASRRREYERLRLMDEDAKNEQEEKEWAEKERERRERDEEKTRKNRERRKKRKGGKKGNAKGDDSGDGEDGADKGVQSKKQKPNPLPRREGQDDEDGHGSIAGVAAVVKENGITIHDDD